MRFQCFEKAHKGVSAQRLSPFSRTVPETWSEGEAEMRNENEAAVRAVFDSWTAAVRRRDIEGILKNHAPDIVMFDVPPPFQSKGIDAYRMTWDTFYSWTSEAIPFQPREIAVTAGDDVAFVVATMDCAEPGADGAPKPLKFRLTVGMQKLGDRWLITHEHHSVPADN